MSASDSSPLRKPKSDHSGSGAKPDRRLQERIPINSQVLICCLDRGGGQRRIKSRAVNVSTSGILLQAEEAGPWDRLAACDKLALSRRCVSSRN